MLENLNRFDEIASFSDVGPNTVDAAPDKLLKETGYRQIGQRLRNDPRYLARFAAASTLLAETISGERPHYHLSEVFQGVKQVNVAPFGFNETLTPGDFTSLFGDILSRQLMAQYQDHPSEWRRYCSVSTAPDFRNMKKILLDGLRQPFDTVAKTEDYHAGAVTDSAVQYAVVKRGKTVPIAWENIINDDLNAFARIPQLLSTGSVHTEEKLVAQLLVNSSGYLSTIFAAGYYNEINTTNGASSTNPAFSYAGIKDGVRVLAKQVDSDGEPIVVTGITVVVPRILGVEAEEVIRKAQSLTITPATTAAGIRINADMPDWHRRLRVAVNPYLDVVNTTSGDTTWFIFADPNDGRPAIDVGFLRGHANPAMFIKEADARRLGGGSNPMDGSFDDDTVHYKVRHVMGGAVIEPRAVVVSNGTGS